MLRGSLGFGCDSAVMLDCFVHARYLRLPETLGVWSIIRRCSPSTNNGLKRKLALTVVVGCPVYMVVLCLCSLSLRGFCTFGSRSWQKQRQ